MDDKAETCPNCGCTSAEGAQSETCQEGEFADAVNDAGDKKTPLKLLTKRNIIIAAAAVAAIILIAVLFNRNVIMGDIKCRSGDYEAAAVYYEKAINGGNSSERLRSQYETLIAYIEAAEAYADDDMETLSYKLKALHKSKSKYPTLEEIRDLQNKYTARTNEVKSIDKLIEQTAELFENPDNIEKIKQQCADLLMQNITEAQIKKINDIQENADNYIDIKNSYDSGKYAEVTEKVSKLPRSYTSYATKDMIRDMKDKALSILDEREKINAKLKSARESFKSDKFNSALSAADELLKMNLTEDELREVKAIKADSEKKIAEQKAAEKPKATAGSQTYPEPEEYSMDGAPSNVKGREEVKNAVKKFAAENNVYLRYIEQETDGSLYMEISCKRDAETAKALAYDIAEKISGCGYNNILTLCFTDIAKDKDAANRVICDADITSSGNVTVYPRSP